MSEEEAQISSNDAENNPISSPKKKKAADSNNLKEDSRTVYLVSLSAITHTFNPRKETDSLFKDGYTLSNPEDPKKGIIQLALSEDMEDVQNLVSMMIDREYDSETSIVALGNDILANGQLEPCGLKGKKTNKTFGVIFGSRRVGAIAFAHALSRVEVSDGTRSKVFNPVVRAELFSCDDDEAFSLAVKENLLRKNFSPWDESEIINAFLKQKIPVIDKETGKPKEKNGQIITKRRTLEQVANILQMKIGTVRNRAVLIKATPEQRDAVDSGKITVTALSQKLLDKEDSDEKPIKEIEPKRKALTLKQMELLFDETPGEIARQAIAKCMNLDYKKALNESELRIQAKEDREAKKLVSEED